MLETTKFDLTESLTPFADFNQKVAESAQRTTLTTHESSDDEAGLDGFPSLNAGSLCHEDAK